MHVAIIGGGGTLGSTLGYTLTTKDPRIDISLVNRTVGKAWAHATDIDHASYHVINSEIGGFPGLSDDELGMIRSFGLDELGELDPSPDLLVYTVAVSRPEEMTGREASYWEFKHNVEITDRIVESMQAVDPVPVIVLTNPIDRITYQLWDRLGWDRGYFIGYSLNEAARIADAIGRKLDVHSSHVHCPVMGEHGSNPVPIFSRVRVDGEITKVPREYRQDILDYIRDIPFEIVEERGEAETSRWVTSAGVTRVIRSIFAGGTDDPLCLSVALDGEYGFDDICLSAPATLTPTGVGEVVEWDLTNEEWQNIDTAYTAVREDIESL